VSQAVIGKTRVPDLHPVYGARTKLGFWIESPVIAMLALTLIGILVAMIAYA
jgi:hypothetical protein